MTMETTDSSILHIRIRSWAIPIPMVKSTLEMQNRLLQR